MSKAVNKLSIIPLLNLPLVKKGDDLLTLIIDSLDSSGEKLRDNDILVIAQKIVSKAEGKTVDLNEITPSRDAQELAREVGKDPRVVHLILNESIRVVRKSYGVLITEHKKGWICADAGVDFSNVAGDSVALLPDDPDKSAETIRKHIRERLNVEIAVLISDSQGRPFRMGSVGVALGYAGMAGLISKIGDEDLYHYRLQHTRIAAADQIASSALLVMGESNEGVPAAIVRGLDLSSERGTSRELIRPAGEDLFR